jgi:hypothetical protein
MLRRLETVGRLEGCCWGFVCGRCLLVAVFWVGFGGFAVGCFGASRNFHAQGQLVLLSALAPISALATRPPATMLTLYGINHRYIHHCDHPQESYLVILITNYLR